LRNRYVLRLGACLMLSLSAALVHAQTVNTVSNSLPTVLKATTALLVDANGVQSLPPSPVRLDTGYTLQWRVQIPVSGYYDVSLTLGRILAPWGLRAEVMLNDRVLGVVYYPNQALRPVKSNLGRLRLEAGEYVLRVRNPYQPVGVFLSLAFSPTTVPFTVPRHTFCTVQDWHLDPPLPLPGHLYAGGNYNFYLPRDDSLICAGHILDSITHKSPGFLVGNGDMVMWGSIESLNIFSNLMSSFPLPWFGTMGHHEVKTIDRATIKQFWGPALPGPSTYYYFDLDGTRYIFLDSAYFQGTDGQFYPSPPVGWTGGVGLCAEEWPWLRGVLRDNQQNQNLPVVVFTHHTIIPYRLPLPPPLAAYQDDYKTVPPADAAELLALLDSDPNVKAVFSGHAHFQMVIPSGHILHVQGAATGEGAMTYLRGLVFDDHLEVETYQAADLKYLQQSYNASRHGNWVVGYPTDINSRVGF
jgi:hypothetical protein